MSLVQTECVSCGIPRKWCPVTVSGHAASQWLRSMRRWVQENSLDSKGKGVFKASGPEKPTVAFRVYSLAGSHNPKKVCEEVLHQR